VLRAEVSNPSFRLDSCFSLLSICGRHGLLCELQQVGGGGVEGHLLVGLVAGDRLDLLVAASSFGEATGKG
jgi:hypothetical protein